MIYTTLAKKVLVTLRQIMRSLALHSRYLEKHYGLTGPQLLLISEIAAHGEISQGKLAVNTCISSATITNTIERLVARGLVVQVRDRRDRRRVIVSVTERARTILDSNPLLVQTGFLEAFEKLDDGRQGELLTSLQDIARMMLTVAVPTHPSLHMRSDHFDADVPDDVDHLLT